MELHPIACYHTTVSFLDIKDQENVLHFFERDARWHRDRIAALEPDHDWFPHHSFMLIESLQMVEVLGGAV